MKVIKAQVQENRARIVEAASKLFRERGYDGVGLADLMGAAGFTHGGFYRHFGSKVDLMAESSAWGLKGTSAIAACMEASEFVKRYVSREHRDAVGEGCTLAALCGDAARQPTAVKAEFAAGVEALLATLKSESLGSGQVKQRKARAELIDLLAHSVGAVMMSRACPDESALADEILQICRERILASISEPK
uniref:Transcriptional regulator, TetR family n=1 Tax=Pseudomonas syringae TaxID=317 RepID=I3W0G7_PSESX|nr:TetR family transcriptional regulator [Pseudomonas syringae]AFK89094.1 Transcriptional regulator, TetR family [Pseudomonas syringae]